MAPLTTDSWENPSTSRRCKRVEDLNINQLVRPRLVGPRSPTMRIYYGIYETHMGKVCRKVEPEKNIVQLIHRLV